MSIYKSWIQWALSVALGLACGTAWAEPMQLSAQGHLRSVGGPVADGNYALAVAIYDQPQGGKPLFLESFLAVPVQGGLFGLSLGASQTPLDTAVFSTGKALWIGITVGGDPELTRQPLLRVPSAVHALVAAEAQKVSCSGCVDATAIAKHAITSDKIAPAAVGPDQVSFAWAAADGPGGAATFALAANAAKFSEQAKNADIASFADEAGSAKTAATAAMALTASVAKDLQCTGCVAADELAADVVDQLIATGKLAAVAQSGQYKDLNGGPDLSGYGALAAKNTWADTQTFGNDLDFAKHQALGFRFQVADKEPYPCAADTIGLTYYDSALKTLRICTGAAFENLAAFGPLGSLSNPALNCQDLLAKKPGTASGVYYLKPTAAPDAFQAYCDMTSDGGGWTLLIKQDGNKATFTYDAALWTNTAALAPDKPDLDATEHKNPGAMTLPFKQVRLVLKNGNESKGVSLNLTANSLVDLWKGPYVPTSIGREGWKGLVSGGSAQPFCNREGVNGSCGSRRVRLGLLTNQENDCLSCDSYIGLGHSGEGGCDGQGASWCGLMASCSPDNGIKSVPTLGYLFVR